MKKFCSECGYKVEYKFSPPKFCPNCGTPMGIAAVNESRPLNRSVSRNKIKEEVVDTMLIARGKFPGSGASLDALCKKFSIDNSRREKHNSVIDCELLSKVYINLLDQKEPMLNFQNQEIVNLKSNLNKTNSYYKKVIIPNTEELKKHKEYLREELKKNYFN